MKNFKIKFHPLFLIFGALLIIIGDGYLFLVYIFTAVIHEYAHSLAAAFYKCRANEITLYPYGAVLYGEFSTLKPSEEAVVALSGPVLNLIVSVLFTALWWIAPELYIYTDIVVMVNISIAVFNLLPVYPLDGGRILMSVLKIKTGVKRAYKIVRVMGIICCIGFLILYMYSFFTEINYTFAFIAIFMFAAVIDNGGSCDGINTVIYPPGEQFLLRGVEKKILRVSGQITLLKLLKMLSTQYYYVIEVTDDKENVKLVIQHKDLEKIIVKFSSSTKLCDIAGGH